MSILKAMIDNIGTMSERMKTMSQITQFYYNDHLSESAKLRSGFKDAGTQVRIDSDGKPVGNPDQPIIVVNDIAGNAKWDGIIQASKEAVESAYADEGRMRALMSTVNRLLPGGEDVAISRLKVGKEETMEDLLAIRAARPVDRALFMKVIADNLGINLAVRRGKLDGQDHAWNEFKDGHGDIVIVDATASAVYNVENQDITRYSDRNGKQLHETQFRSQFGFI